MIAPDAQFLDGADRLAGLGRKLRQRAVVIEAQHRGEVLLRQRRRGLHRDVRVGVGGVADDQHPDAAGGDRIERLALLDEDLRVLQQEVLALHARAARLGPDQHRVVGVLEGDLGIAGPHDAGDERERRVLELHDHPLQGGLHLVDGQFEELQNHRLVAAEHFAGGDAEQERISDLAGGAGDGNSYGIFHGGSVRWKLGRMAGGDSGSRSGEFRCYLEYPGGVLRCVMARRLSMAGASGGRCRCERFDSRPVRRAVSINSYILYMISDM